MVSQVLYCCVLPECRQGLLASDVGTGPAGAKPAELTGEAHTHMCNGKVDHDFQHYLAGWDPTALGEWFQHQ